MSKRTPMLFIEDMISAIEKIEKNSEKDEGGTMTLKLKQETEFKQTGIGEVREWEVSL